MGKELQTIIEVVHQVKGSDPLYLSEPVLVRVSPYAPPVEIHGLIVSPKGKLYLMDSAGEWNELEHNDLRADEVIAAVYKRIARDFKPIIGRVVV